ncbi:MAG: efflux RND transporter periplasmic adaptor subunit [Acidobacteriota bacterium]
MSVSPYSSRHPIAGTAMVLAAVFAAMVATACSHQDPPAQEATHEQAAELRLKPDQLAAVRTAPVISAPFTRLITASGTVAFDQNRSTQVLAPLSGPVSRLLVDVGARVRKDQSLAIVASPDFAVNVSALRKAESAARNARRIADMDRQLFQNDAIARRDMEQAETDAVAAEADRDAAIETLRALGVDAKTLADLRENRPIARVGGDIRSPLAGTVVEKLISPGQLLQAGSTACFTVADLSRVWVLANIFEADLPFVAAGDSAEISTGSGAPALPGTVEYIAAVVDPNTRAIAVRLAVANPGEVLKRDLYVQVTLRSRRPVVALLAPVSAVLRDDENLPFVFVAGPGGAFARRRIQIGARSGDQQEITDGLKAGESVVVEGGIFLQNTEVAP